jgi:hypothetical protein
LALDIGVAAYGRASDLVTCTDIVLLLILAPLAQRTD